MYKAFNNSLYLPISPYISRRVLMYKAFNTFIDDAFALMVGMRTPTPTPTPNPNA